MIEKERTTKETSVSLRLDVDGGDRRIDIPCGFLRHMLELFAFHAGIGLDVTATGDVDVDCHHVTEDIGILLGKAFEQARSGRNIPAYGWCAFPWTALLCWPPSISAAGGFEWKGAFPAERCGDFDLDFCPSSGARSAAKEGSRSTRRPSPDNAHHLAEAALQGSGQGVPAGPLPPTSCKARRDARMIGVVDYRVGNTGNVRRAFERIGGRSVCSSRTTRRPRFGRRASGSGHSDRLPERLAASGWRKHFNRGRVPGGRCSSASGCSFCAKRGLRTEYEGLGLIRNQPPCSVQNSSHGVEHCRMDRSTAVVLPSAPDGSFFYFVHSFALPKVISRQGGQRSKEMSSRRWC